MIRQGRLGSGMDGDEKEQRKEATLRAEPVL
jgi:hypothetical protein